MYANYDVIIVGAGLGGLTCGAVLAAQGRKVLICERNNKAGGYVTGFYKGGFAFDAVHTLIGGCGQGEIISNVLELISPSLPVSFQQVDPITKIVLPDLEFDFQSWNLSLELENLFPEEEQNILCFLQEIEKINAEKTSLVFSKPAYLLSPLERAALEMKTRLTKPKLYKYRFKTASDVLGSFFKEERLKTIFHTVVPWERASFLQLAQRWTAFLKRGLYYPKGGYQALANCFVDGFLNQGGQLILNSQVAKILLQGEKAVGVELTDGTKISTDKVVAGCDLRETLEVLVGKEHFPEEYFNSLAVKKLSSSAFYVYLGVSIPEDRIPFSRAVLCSVNNIEQFSGHLEDGETCPVFIDIPNKYDPDMAAGGNSIIILSVPASVSDLNNWGINGTGLSGKKYNVLKAEIADKLIERCEKLIPGLKERIVVKTVATPYTFQSCTSNQNGAAFGWAELPGELERPGQVSPIKNLYFVGHWTYPGGGIPSVVESGMVLANLIANEKI